MNISFITLTSEQMDLILRWLKEPHVQEFWHESDNDEEVREKFLVKLKDYAIEAFIIQVDQQPIGYIQSYEACRMGGGWWTDVPPRVYGIDQFIGDPAFIGRGVGSIVVRCFIEELCKKKSVKEVIVDPDPLNLRAIRMYEKIGFVAEGVIQTPGGKARLMRFRPG